MKLISPRAAGREVVRRLTTRDSRPLPRAAASGFGALREGSLRDTVWWLAFGVTLVGMCVPQLRHLAYFTPFLAVLYALSSPVWPWPHIVRPFAFLIVVGLLLSPLATETGFKDLFFIASAIAISLLVPLPKIRAELFLGAFFLAFVSTSALSGNLTKGFTFDIAGSASSLESSFSFNFGLMAVYFALKRRWSWFFVCLFLTFVTLKRIALGGVLLCMPLVFMPEIWRKRVCNATSMIAVNLAFVLLAVGYGTYAYDQQIAEWTGQSANQFGNGRQALYSQIAFDIDSAPLRYAFIGAGPGQAYEASRSEFSTDGKSPNLHSDILKVFYEYGGLALCLFLWLLYRNPSGAQRTMLLYLNVMFLTDNVLIYHFVIFFVCQLCQSFDQDGQIRSTPKPSQARPWARPPAAT